MACLLLYQEQAMKTKTLHNAFPIVAAAIGNRFGIKVSVGGDKAYTDGKTIQLPAYPIFVTSTDNYLLIQ